MFLAEAFGTEAVGGAVLAAAGYVFKVKYDRFQADRRMPKLSFGIVSDLAPGVVNKRNCSFGRLSLENALGREAAVNVKVQIDMVVKVKTDAVAGPDENGADYLSGSMLAWAKADRGEPYVKATPITLAGGGTQQVDLIHLNERISKAIVDVRPQPGNHLNRLGPGVFRFELAVSAENAGTKRYSLEVTFSEGWDGNYGSASGHLALRNLRPL